MIRARSGRGRRRAMRQVLAMLVLALGLLIVPSSAWAGPKWCQDQRAPDPVPPGFGTSALMADPQGAAQHIYESQLNEQYSPRELGSSGLYQQRGMIWHVAVTEDCFDPHRYSFWDAIYNPIWNTSLEINNFAMNAYMVASSDTILLSFEELITEVTEQLRDSIWRPLIPAMVVIGALTLGWYAFIRKQVTLTLQGAVWMVASTAIGMYMLFAPAQVLAFASALTTGAGGLVNNAISNVTVSGMTERCPGDAERPQQADDEPLSMYAARKNAQMVWEGLMCRPWMAGLVGTSEEANAISEEHGMALLQASTITYEEMENGSYLDLREEKMSQYVEIGREIRGEEVEGDAWAGPPEFQVFTGDNGSHRLGVASGALVGSLTGGLLVLVASMALIVFKLTFVVLFLLAPIFLLIGIHPGYGRIVLQRWAVLTFGFLVKQVVVMLLLSLLILMLGVIMGMGLPFLLQLMMMIGLMIGAFFAWRPLWSILSNANMQPANGTPSMPAPLRKLGRTLAKTTVAAATGGSALAAMTGLPYAGGGRGRAGAARGLGRRMHRGAAGASAGAPAGLKAAELDPRWGKVLDARRETDGDNGEVRMRRGGVVGRMRDAAGVRPTGEAWRRDNPVLAGWEAHRWSGMSPQQRREAVKHARQDPQGYVRALQAERTSWAAQAREAGPDAPPPLTPHQKHRVRKAEKVIVKGDQKRADSWARRGGPARVRGRR